MGETNTEGPVQGLVEKDSGEPAEFGQRENLCQVNKIIIVQEALRPSSCPLYLGVTEAIPSSLVVDLGYGVGTFLSTSGWFLRVLAQLWVESVIWGRKQSNLIGSIRHHTRFITGQVGAGRQRDKAGVLFSLARHVCGGGGRSGGGRG